MPASGRIDELRKRYDENQRRFFAPLANEYRKAGDLEQAIDLCRLHLSESPANLNGQIVFGQALYEAGSLDEARTAFEAAIVLDPENLIALRHLGDISREQGDIPKARDWYRRVLDADRRNEEVIAILHELDAVEAAGGRAAVAERSPTPNSGGIATIELEEPPMRAPAPARPSIMSLIGAPPEDTREMPVEESVDETAADPEPTPVVAPDVIEIETTSLAYEEPPVRVATPAEDLISIPDPDVQPRAAVPDLDTIDFGDAPAVGAASESPSAPDSSFGFEVDLGAAADIPVATSVGDTGDFGAVDLPDDAPFRETEEVKPVGIETAADSFGGTVNLDETPVAAPAVDESVDLDTFGTVDLDSEPPAPPEPDIAPAPLTLMESDPEPIDLESDPISPKLELVKDTPVETFAIDAADTIQIDDAIAESSEPLDLVVDDPVIPPVEETRPRRSTPVVFNFDISGDDDAPTTPTPANAAPVVDLPVVELPTEEETEVATPEVEDAQPFATETMAELYLSQGLRHEAIAVYKQLVEAKPHDDSLRQRLAELEDDGRIKVGNTARDFFSSLSRRAAKGRATGTHRLPSTTPPRGSLDKLFDGSPVARHDQSAAESLSAAFGAGPAQPEESALDRVFNQGPARPPSR